jgi:hypothetical protein
VVTNLTPRAASRSIEAGGQEDMHAGGEGYGLGEFHVGLVATNAHGRCVHKPRDPVLPKLAQHADKLATRIFRVAGVFGNGLSPTLPHADEKVFMRMDPTHGRRIDFSRRRMKHAL